MTSPYLNRPLRRLDDAIDDRWAEAIDPALISDAAEATELFSEDELEQFALTYNKTRKDKV